MKTETCKLYSRDFWIFLPNVIKIDHYNSELYRFKVGVFFWDTVYYYNIIIIALLLENSSDDLESRQYRDLAWIISSSLYCFGDLTVWVWTVSVTISMACCPWCAFSLMTQFYPVSICEAGHQCDQGKTSLCAGKLVFWLEKLVWQLTHILPDCVWDDKFETWWRLWLSAGCWWSS